MPKSLNQDHGEEKVTLVPDLERDHGTIACDENDIPRNTKLRSREVNRGVKKRGVIAYHLERNP